MPLTKYQRPKYIPNGDRVSDARHEIDEAIAENLVKAIRSDLPELMNGTWPDFCRRLMQISDAMLDVPEHRRSEVDNADELVVRAALSSRNSPRRSQTSSVIN